MRRIQAILLPFAALGVAQALLAAVQNVEITAANAYAYSADNPLVCDSGSQITVKHSYRADGRTMKEALIDFIQVAPAATGERQRRCSRKRSPKQYQARRTLCHDKENLIKRKKESS